jgi:arsenate reductase
MVSGNSGKVGGVGGKSGGAKNASGGGKNLGASGKSDGVRGARHRLLGPRTIPSPGPVGPRSVPGPGVPNLGVPSSGLNSLGVSSPGSSGPAPAASQPSSVPQTAPAGGGAPVQGGKGVARRVLFVCIGNSCRSQMAEAFAKTYGADVMVVESAGLSPATMIAPLTRQMLTERNIEIEQHFPKSLFLLLNQHLISNEPFDIIVNISGHPLPSAPEPNGAQIIEWNVVDPIGQKEEVYRAVATQLELLVMRLILDLRTGVI